MIRNLILTIFFSLIISSSFAWGQGSRSKDVYVLPSKESQSALIRRAFEAEIQNVLNKYLKSHQYAIDVEFKMEENSKNLGDVPYAPDSIIPDSYQGLPKSEDLKKLRDLRVTIMVPKWMDTSTQATLKNLLNRRLQNLTGSPVNLVIEAMNLNLDEPSKPQTIVNQTADSSASNHQRQQADLDDLKKQLERERQDLKDEIKDLKKRLADQGASGNVAGSPNAGKGTFHDFWEFAKSNPLGAGIIFLLLYLSVFTLAFLPARSISSGLGGVQSAFASVAQSIKGMADSIGKSISSSASNDEHKSSDHQVSSVSPTPPLSSQAPIGGSGKNLHPSYPEIKQIALDMQQSHEPELDEMVQEMIQDFLGPQGQGNRAILLLELLGPEHAERIYNLLTMTQKDKLVALIRTVDRSAADKPELMYEVAAAYQTKKIAFGWRANLDKNISRMLSSLSTAEKVQLALQIKSDPTLQRFMLYLEVADLSELLGILKQNPDEKIRAIRCLAQMPLARGTKGADPEIERQAASFVKRKEEDHYQIYLDHFESIIQSSGEELEDEILEIITQTNPQVGGQLRQRVVTLSDFFRCSASIRRDILAAFSNSELAALITSFDDKNKALCMNDIDSRRQELVQEQIQMLLEDDKSLLAEKQRNLKARLKKALVSRKSEIISEASPLTQVNQVESIQEKVQGLSQDPAADDSKNTEMDFNTDEDASVSSLKKAA